MNKFRHTVRAVNTEFNNGETYERNRASWTRYAEEGLTIEPLPTGFVKITEGCHVRTFPHEVIRQIGEDMITAATQARDAANQPDVEYDVFVDGRPIATVKGTPGRGIPRVEIKRS